MALVLIFLGCNERATLLEIVTVRHSEWDDIKHILTNQLPKDTGLTAGGEQGL